MRRSDGRARARFAVIAAAVVVLLGAAGTTDAGAGVRTSSAPRLGRAFRTGLAGFGQSRPRRIFLGGDPTGLVEKIRWSSWGGARASASGNAEYVWPGTSVAANAIAPGARIVAFHLGTCRGVRSYNALEWYFPRYGETFDPRDYIDTCTGSSVGMARSSSCADVTLTDGAGRATFVTAVGLSCARAAGLIAALPVARYLPKGGRFSDSGLRCGSEGVGAEGGAPLFACQSGAGEFSFFVEP